MKKYILKSILLSIVFTLSACDDFFNPETDNVLDHNKYINVESEMYAGYIGIITKVQVIGDKIIYLTDTRGEMLEPTINTPNDLYSIYNYDNDLAGNAYADPAPYYDVIIACNDYLQKIYDYKQTHSASINKTHYEALVSSTLRIKAWVYLTLGKVYGEAVWFDDPMRENKDLSKFPLLKLDEVVTSCKTLLDTGFDGIDGTHSFSWKEWLDPHTETGTSIYRYWDFMTPEYFALYAELSLWNGDYQKTADLILTAMNTKFAGTINDATQWMHNDKLVGAYSTVWNLVSPMPQEVVSAIMYDYSNNQTNQLLKHFGTEYPNEYLLAPSEVGRSRFLDPVFNPLGTESADKRGTIAFTKNNEGKYVIQKFRPISNPVRTNPYQDDVHIYIYRGSDLYFMLAEALNNLGRYEAASYLINQGVNGKFPNGGIAGLENDTEKKEWSGFTDAWTSASPLGTRKYPDKGIRGAFKLGSRPFSDNMKDNDKAILDEMMLEFPCEGKIYPAMIRVAMRHGDFNIIADRVCPKYKDPESIRNKILTGGYFIKWDLKK